MTLVVSRLWYAAYTDASGIRRFKSTKETKRKRAEAVANGWQRAVDFARKGILTQVQAVKVISEIYEAVNQEALNSADTASFFRDWVESKKLTTAKGTARRYGDVIKLFVTQLGDKAQRNLTGLVPREIAAFRDTYIKEGKANKTANMAVKTLRIALNMARKQGLIMSNPAEAVDMLPENSVSREPLSRQQILDLLAIGRHGMARDDSVLCLSRSATNGRGAAHMGKRGYGTANTLLSAEKRQENRQSQNRWKPPCTRMLRIIWFHCRFTTINLTRPFSRY